MQLCSNNKRRIISAFFAVILVLGSLAAWQIRAGADPAPITVTSTADSGPGTMRQAVIDANAAAGDFKIIIEVDGTLITTTELPLLQVFGRNGLIQSKPSATITGFSSEINDGGHLTLENVIIDNSANDLVAVLVSDFNSENTLLLGGSNHITGSVPGYDFNIYVAGTLTIDKVPGSSDMDSTLILSDTDIEIRGVGPLLVKGGTIEANGAVDGIHLLYDVLVEGGKVISTGQYYGIVSVNLPWSTVEINGGTVVAHGSPYDILAENLVFNGGSIDAREFLGSYPINGSGNPVYLVTVTLGDPAIKNTEVSCSVNDGTPFTCITDADGKLYLWMPEGNGAAEVNVGKTVYHASGSVAANYDNVMIALLSPVVTGVVVTPTYTTALTGGTVQFSASVEGLYNPPQTVTWSVENGHQDTSVSNTGLLTISPSETSTNLLVTATSTYDPSKSATAQVAVPSVAGVIVTPTYTTALTGGTVQFSASVVGLYNPPQTVTWSVENGHQDTSISNTGLLTISPSETSTNLLVTATSTYDPSKSATAQVAVPSVAGVIVTPTYTTALTGGTMQFSAFVVGLYNPPQTVTWSVENGHQDTSISNTGLLTISPSETSTNLLVIATSTYDPSKSATAQVAVPSMTGVIIGMVLLFLFFVILVAYLEERNPFRR